MRTRHKGPGILRHQVLGVKELGSPTRSNPTLSLALARVTRRPRNGDAECTSGSPQPTSCGGV